MNLAQKTMFSLLSMSLAALAYSNCTSLSYSLTNSPSTISCTSSYTMPDGSETLSGGHYKVFFSPAVWRGPCAAPKVNACRLCQNTTKSYTVSWYEYNSDNATCTGTVYSSDSYSYNYASSGGVSCPN